MNGLLESYYSLCPPAKLYVFLSIINASIYIIAISRKDIGVDTTMPILAMLLGFCLWTYILNLICSNGWEIISWVLVTLPLIVTFISTSILLYINK